VKLQIVNLAAKLCVTNKKQVCFCVNLIEYMPLVVAMQTKLLYQYVLNLAKYDQNYDIRDRARFLRQLVLPDEVINLVKNFSCKVFLCRIQHFLSMPRKYYWPTSQLQSWSHPTQHTVFGGLGPCLMLSTMKLMATFSCLSSQRKLPTHLSEMLKLG